MKHFRTILLAGALTILAVMAYLNIHVHLSFAQHDDHASGTPVSSTPSVDPTQGLRGASTDVYTPPYATPLGASMSTLPTPTVPPSVPAPPPPVALPSVTQPAFTHVPDVNNAAVPVASPTAPTGAKTVADIPAHLLNPSAGASTVPPAPAPEPAPAPVPASPQMQQATQSLPEGLPGTTMAELSALPAPLDRTQRRALYDYCKDKQDTVVFYTYANIRGKDDKFCRYLESVIQNDIDITVLNWGGEHKGNGNKLVFTRKAIETLHPCDVFVFSDAFDVLYAEPAEEIAKKFFAINAPVIVSAECGCWPFIVHKNGNDICLNQFPKSPTDYRYINSGMWAARAYAAEDLIRRIMERNNLATVQKMSDQEQISTLLLKGEYDWHKDIQIDYYASMFLNMHMADDYGRCDPEKDVIFKDGRLFNRRTNYVPAMYHFNGGSKKRMGDAEESMWYKQEHPIRPAKDFVTVSHHPIKIRDKDMNLETVSLRDMCPGYSGQSLLSKGQRNFFKRG